MAKPAYYKMLQSGSAGPDVSLVQIWLNGVRSRWTCIPAVQVDGKFGSGTASAVRQFQTAANLTVDGKVGNNTWNALYEAYASLHGEGEQYPGTNMRSGTSGATVRSAQARLTAKGFPLSADGMFGNNTANATKAFQRASGLRADGVIGRDTWAKLYA